MSEAIYLQDIDEKILNAIGQIFAEELLEAPAQAGDTLALKTLKQAPLQDDPTLTAPFIVYNNCGGSDGKSMCLISSHGEEAKEYGSSEIGGPIRFLYSYECSFGTVRATSREIARAAGATLMSRIIRTLMDHEDLSNILDLGALRSDDGEKYIEGQNKRLVTSAGYDIYGGESEFYGKGKVFWRYPVSWNV